MSYCDIDDVKRILRVLNNSGNNQYKVRFSDSYSIPEAYSTNTGTGKLKGISVLTSFAGSEEWHIEFTSGTGFTLYRSMDTTINDGSGSVSAAFVSTSGIITIASAQWVGTPVSGDKFKFRTNSNISDNDAEGFIEDADVIIDGMASKLLKTTSVPFTTVPNLIKRASMYIAANLIFSSIYGTANTDEISNIVRSWLSFGRNLVTTYIESIPAAEHKKYAAYARFITREPIFTKIGITEAAGVEGGVGEIDTVNVNYDEDQNDNESVGST